MRREDKEALFVYNITLCNIYHGIPLVFYVMDEYPKLVLLLRERKYSSLRSLFEDAQEVEENIHFSRRIQEKLFFENLHEYEQEECRYILDLKQEESKYDSDLESNS
jgi:hypothetical protein